MCHLVYTNFQRQGAVINMTVGEIRDAERSKDHRVISVWEHKTVAAHGPAKIACHVKYYQLLLDLIGDRERSDIFFLTSTGEKVTHVAYELEKLGDAFGKKLICTPTMNRKRIATSIGAEGSEKAEKGAASHMSHSIEVHRSVYQHHGDKHESVDKYVFELLHHYAHALMPHLFYTATSD